VQIAYADGSAGSAAVAWEPVSPELYAAPGTFAARGWLGETLSVAATVTVKGLLSIGDITVYSIAGAMPEMPATVDAVFEDGTGEPLGVVWDLSPDALNYPGIVKITGAVLDSDVTAAAWVHVQFAVDAAELAYAASPPENVKKGEAYNGGQLIEKGGSLGAPPTYHANGFGTLAAAGGTEITIDISGRGFQRFSGIASISAIGGPGSVEAEIYVDGELAFAGGADGNGGPMTGMSESGGRPFAVDVAGASTVRLVTYSKGSGAEWAPTDDVADWCDVKFLSTDVATRDIRFSGQNVNLFRIKSGQIPALDKTVVADAGLASDAAAVATGTFLVTWPRLDAGMFSASGVKTVYGRVEGTSNGIAVAKVVTDYRAVRGPDSLPASALGEYRALERFDYSTTAGSAPAPAEANITHSMIDAWSTVGIENNLANPGYGFEYGVYPTAANATSSITLYAPGLKRFAIRGTGNFQSTGNVNPQNLDFAISVSETSDGPFAAVPDGSRDKAWEQTSGDWRSFSYASTADVAEGTNYIRITWPSLSSGNYWRYNLNRVFLEGGEKDPASGGNAGVLGFKFGDYDGDIDLDAGTIGVTVPEGVDITNVAPVFDLVSKTADYAPKGPQDFSEPVGYTVTDGGVSKTYTVSVTRGYNVVFWLNGGAIGGDASDAEQFVKSGTAPSAPASPTKALHSFIGWGATRDAASSVDLAEQIITGDTVYYARYDKAASLTINASADAGMKTWQAEKGSNYGSDSTMLVRQNTATGTNGLFGQNFTTTSTSDGTDMKTAYIRIDVSQLDGVEVTSAQLNVRYTGNTNSGGNGGTSSLLVARVASSNWSESSITWNSRPRELYGDGSSATAEGVAQSGNFSAAQSTAANTVTDVLKLYSTLPSTESAITFAVTIDKSNRDYQLMTKEGAGANAANAPRLVLGIVPKPDYRAIYELNGGTGKVPLEPDMEAGAEFAVAGASGLAGPEGMVLKEWNTEADGTGTGYSPGDIAEMPDADMTLHAIWAKHAIASFEATPDSVGSVTIRSSAPEGLMLILAAYGGNGALAAVSTYSLDAGGGQEQEIATGFAIPAGASVRAFLWDKNYVPMTEPKAIR
jgi:hypothetical protein